MTIRLPLNATLHPPRTTFPHLSSTQTTRWTCSRRGTAYPSATIEIIFSIAWKTTRRWCWSERRAVARAPKFRRYVATDADEWIRGIDYRWGRPLAGADRQLIGSFVDVYCLVHQSHPCCWSTGCFLFIASRYNLTFCPCGLLIEMDWLSIINGTLVCCVGRERGPG